MINLTLTAPPSVWLDEVVNSTYSFKSAYTQVEKAKADYLSALFKYSPQIKLSFSKSSIDEPSVSQIFNSYPINSTSLEPSFSLLFPGGGSLSGKLTWQNSSSTPVAFPGFPPPSGESYTRKLSFSFNQPLLKGFFFPPADLVGLRVSKNNYFIAKHRLREVSSSVKFALSVAYFRYLISVLNVYYDFENYLLSLESFLKTSENFKYGAVDESELISAKMDLLSKTNSLKNSWNSALDAREDFLSMFPEGKVVLPSLKDLFDVSSCDDLVVGVAASVNSEDVLAERLAILKEKKESMSPVISSMESFLESFTEKILNSRTDFSRRIESLERRALYAAEVARLSYENAKLNYSYMKSMALPSLNFFATFSFYGNSKDPDEALTVMMDRNHTSWNFGVVFQMPVVPGKSISDVKSAKAQLEVSRIAYVQSRQKSIEEFERAYRNFCSSVESYKNTRKLLDLAERLFQRQEKRYFSATIPFKVFAGSQSTLISMKKARSNSAFALISSYFNFIKSFDGWRLAR